MTAAMRSQPQFTSAPSICYSIYRKRMVLMLICSHAEMFKDTDLDWVTRNFHIWEAFEAEANKIWARGRTHYSTRTIGEYLRHETATRENAADGWKVNDHAWPSLARIYMLMYPDRAGFFERRPGGSAVRSQ